MKEVKMKLIVNDRILRTIYYAIENTLENLSLQNVGPKENEYYYSLIDLKYQLKDIIEGKRDYIPELLRSKENRIEIERIDESLINDLIEDLEIKPKYTQYTIWHDGGEWFIGVKGNEMKECKRLTEWLRGEILEKDKRRILQSI
jgi:hypothetical protein